MRRRWEIGLSVASLLVGVGFNLYALSARRRVVYLTDEQLAALKGAPARERAAADNAARAQFELSAFGRRR